MIELTDNTKENYLLWLAGSLQWEPDGSYSWQFPGTQRQMSLPLYKSILRNHLEIMTQSLRTEK